MVINDFNYKKIKEKYLGFIKAQEILSEPFRDKINQLNKFYLPISKKIYDLYLISKKTKIIGLTGGQGSGKSTISKILKIIFANNDHSGKSQSLECEVNTTFIPKILIRGIIKAEFKPCICTI